MDAHSINKLEFARVRDLLAAHCRCALGRELAGQIEPARKPPMIRRWLGQTAEMDRVIEHAGVPPLSGIRDVREQVRRAVPPIRLAPEDFAAIAEVLAATHDVRKWIDGCPGESPTLLSVTERVVDFKFIADQIGRAIEPDGRVRDDASEGLARIRKAIGKATDQIGVVIERLLRSAHVTKMLQFPNAMFHDDRVVLPLKSEHRGRLEGIIHRSSDSGATLFVEPAEVVELNNAITKLRRDEHEEIGRILFKLTQAVHANAQEIIKTINAIGVLDLVAAKSAMARAYDMIVPEISEDGVLRLRSARHPLLLAMRDADVEEGRPPRSIVPIDVRLGEDFDLLIVTGPNTGGKTVALKTVGLLTIMVHAGLPVPVSPGSTVPIFHDVLIDVGDEQSLQQSLSTFSAHMVRILDVLKRAGKNTLVLLDEVGAGTDPDEGAAIGMTVIERLLDTACPTMVTTHLGALKALAFTHERADNAAVEFDVETLRPTYRLLIGEPGQSNALAVAGQLGMPAEMVETARKHLPEQHKALSEAIAGTIDSRRRAEQAREQAEDARIAASDAEAAAKAVADDLARQKEDFQRWSERVAYLKPGDVVKVLSFDRTGRVIRVLLSQQRVEVDLGTKNVVVPMNDLHPEDTPAPPAKPARPAQPPAADKKVKPVKAKAPTPKTTNNKPKRPLPYANVPCMPEAEVLGLEAGQQIFVRRFGKSAQVIRLKPDKRTVIVDLGAMDAEVGFGEICRHNDKHIKGARRTGDKPKSTNDRPTKTARPSSSKPDSAQAT